MVFRAPRGVLLGRAAWCARGRRPAREPSAPRASLGASPRSPARPRRRPRAPQPGPPVPPTPFTPAPPSVLCGAVQAPPPPTGTAAGLSGALHTSGAWSLTCGGVCCFAFRPGPAAPAMSHAIPSNVFHGLKFDRWNSADSALMWRRAERELHAELWDGVSPPRSCLFLRRNALVAGGIALLGLTMHCLVARATVCYLVHCLPFRCNALPG